MEKGRASVRPLFIDRTVCPVGERTSIKLMPGETAGRDHGKG